jgi:hypothetical protein
MLQATPQTPKNQNASKNSKYKSPPGKTTCASQKNYQIMAPTAKDVAQTLHDSLVTTRRYKTILYHPPKTPTRGKTHSPDFANNPDRKTPTPQSKSKQSCCFTIVLENTPIVDCSAQTTLHYHPRNLLNPHTTFNPTQSPPLKQSFPSPSKPPFLL